MSTWPDTIVQLFLQVDAAFEKDTENDAELAALLRGPALAIAQTVVIDINRIASALERIAVAHEKRLRVEAGV